LARVGFIWGRLIKGAEITSLYEEGSKKIPKDEDFGKQWFQQMILRGDIDGSRKVHLHHGTSE
jgi:hypothetical protein